MAQRPSPARSPARPARTLVRWFSAAVARFLRVEAAGGLILLGATAMALVWANSPWSAGYRALWRLPVTFAIGGTGPTQTLHFWVNDGLMAVFFLVVGLEIRRELHEGALASRRHAMLPVLAALGGMIAPALLFLALDHGALLRRGWAVPMATDIAFAVGVLALLGPRVPRAVRALLLALAIIDDIGAVAIIALFYSRGVMLPGLIAVAVAAAAVLALNRLGLRSSLVYAAAGIIMWLGLLHGGVHPTLAGVILGFLIPVTPASRAPPRSESPSVRLGETLHPWVAYGVMPIFALANAGIRFDGLRLSDPAQVMTVVGIAVSLVLGKPLGIGLAALGGLRLRLCELPRGVTLKGVGLAGCLGGIGFTMSIFIAGLAFGDDALLAAAKLGILAGSAGAALCGITVGRLVFRRG